MRYEGNMKKKSVNSLTVTMKLVGIFTLCETMLAHELLK